MITLVIMALLPFVLGSGYMLNLDCSQTPGPCQNNCYGAYVMGKSVNLNYNGPDGQSGRRRREAGCVSPTPCRSGKMARPNDDENTCDEYPYASTVEGGSGSAIRCTAGDENSEEGNDLSRALREMCDYEPCTFLVTFGNPGGGLTPYCLDGGGANDGFQYIYNGNGNYGLAKKDSNITEEHSWTLHEADPALYFPPHLRREFLLDNGERTVIGSRDLDADYSNHTFFTQRNGTLQKNRAVRELFGAEKTWELQHPSLRKAKKSVPFAA